MELPPTSQLVNYLLSVSLSECMSSWRQVGAATSNSATTAVNSATTSVKSATFANRIGDNFGHIGENFWSNEMGRGLNNRGTGM